MNLAPNTTAARRLLSISISQHREAAAECEVFGQFVPFVEAALEDLHRAEPRPVKTQADLAHAGHGEFSLGEGVHARLDIPFTLSLAQRVLDKGPWV
jgi:hypothetical protein